MNSQEREGTAEVKVKKEKAKDEDTAAVFPKYDISVHEAYIKQKCSRDTSADSRYIGDATADLNIQTQLSYDTFNKEITTVSSSQKQSHNSECKILSEFAIKKENVFEEYTVPVFSGFAPNIQEADMNTVTNSQEQSHNSECKTLSESSIKKENVFEEYTVPVFFDFAPTIQEADVKKKCARVSNTDTDNVCDTHAIKRRNLTDEEIAKELEYDSDMEFEMNDDMTDTEDLVEHVEESDWNSTSENEDEGEIPVSKHGFEWSLLPPSSSRRQQCNIVTETSGLRNSATLVNTIGEMFALFISADMVREICEETNRQLGRTPGNRIEQLSEDELYAFIGIMLASGRNRTRKLSFNELWSNEGPFCQPFFTAAMSRDRFISIYSQIRFDNRETRRERFETSLDKLEPVKSIYSKLVDACKSNYSPSADITVDVRLAAYKGNCPFRVCMKSKAARYGIKIWVAADAKTAYICNMQVYTGMINNKREVNQGNRVAMELVEPQYGTNRGVTTGNFFTSMSLADNLLSKNLTITGTLRKNKREIPMEFLPSKERPLYSTLFGFTPNKTLVSYVPQQNKAVLLLSTQFLSNEISQTETKKPEMILHYNKTKGAVDTGDKMTAEYSCVRSTRRWPFRLFMEMLDIAALNTYLLWIEKYPEWKKNNRSKRKCFIRELSLDLSKPNIIRRNNSMVRFHKQQLDAFDTVLSYYQQISPATAVAGDIPSNPLGESTSVPVSRAPSRTCRFCPYNAKKRSTIICHVCHKSVCTSHRKEKKYISCSNCDKI